MNNITFKRKEIKVIFLCAIAILASFAILNIFNLDSFAIVTTGEATSGDLTKPLKNFYKEYKFYVNLFTGFVVLSNLLIFIYHFCRLGMVSDNPQERRKCLNDMLICGVCLALIGGGATVVYILFFIGN